MAKKLIISNRLPVKISQGENGLEYKPSEGGLATGLGSIYKEGGNLWIGWPGLDVESEEMKEEIRVNLKNENMQPVFLTRQEITDYYEGFSNETLWPTFHYFSQYAEYEQPLWEAYQRVNKKFCDEIIKLAEPDDTLWIHDYQLLLLPEMVREKLPNASIGFFLHIPFPSYEVFRLLPWRKEILLGLLGADLLGFHTYDDMRHFLSSVSRLASLSNVQGHIETGDRTLVVDSFPMGIDYEKYQNSAKAPETLERISQFRETIKDQKLIISIDRLDYSKGIPQRLRAFENFLENHPEYVEKTTLYMIVVPSRDQVEKYKMLKEEVDELVGRINGEYGTVAWTPIHYFYRSFPLEVLSAFYRMADIALVTPMRDGMNLVCKEYIASKIDEPGVLILSEMAGASKELTDSLLINPNNINQIADAIYQALIMPEEEQKRRLLTMQNTIKRFNIHHWVSIFMDRLAYIKDKQRTLATKNVDQEMYARFRDVYQKSNQRLIFLDYGDTLVPTGGDPLHAAPDDDLKSIISELTRDDRNKVVIISGRDRVTLSKWFEDIKVDLIGEHGIWLREGEADWRTIQDLNSDWKQEILPVLELYVNRTPGSYIEEKDYSLVWHYRKVETGLGELRTREITSHLKYMAANSQLQVLEGDLVVEIKNTEVNKGKAALKWVEKYPADFILAIGDDWTDEDVFQVMPENAYTMRVGSPSSSAKYSISGPPAVRALLRALME